MNKEEKHINKSDENNQSMDNENLTNEDEEVDEKINKNLKRNKEMNKALKKVLKELNKENKNLSQ